MEVAKIAAGAKQSSLAPTDVKATVKGTNVIVQWTAPVSPVGVNLTGYTVTRDPGGQSVNATNTETHVTISGLAAGTYTFKVIATYSDSTSASSAPSDPVAMS